MVEKEDILPGSGGYACVLARHLPFVFSVPEHFAAKAGGQLHGAVGRTVVNYYYFGVKVLAHYAFNCFAEVIGTVLDRYYD